MLGAAAASDIPSVPVTDVQINGTSILSSGIANIPLATDTTPGVMRYNTSFGLAAIATSIPQTGESISWVGIYSAPDDAIKAGTQRS
jgi:hypothetical protein